MRTNIVGALQQLELRGHFNGENLLGGRVSMRAMVIDDSKAIRRIIGKILKDLGFEVFEAVM